VSDGQRGKFLQEQIGNSFVIYEPLALKQWHRGNMLFIFGRSSNGSLITYHPKEA
jgi:hypothetical protein